MKRMEAPATQRKRTILEISFPLETQCLFKENSPFQCVCSLLDTCGFVTIDLKPDFLLLPLRLCLHVCMCFLLVGESVFSFSSPSD